MVPDRCTLPRRAGFTLVEMSIVLVVIGLVVGGVIIGREMIATGKIIRANRDFNDMGNGIRAFQLKYNCLPGDCAKASQYFTLAANDGVWWSGNPNGNGNNRIDAAGEAVTRFWEHLGKAGFWPGSFSGGVGTALNPGVNVPNLSWAEGNSTSTSSSGLALYALYNDLCPPGFSAHCETYTEYATNTHMVMVQGIFTGAPNTGWVSPGLGLTCGFAFALDNKYDDGMPHTGRIQSIVLTAAASSCTGVDARSTTLSPATQYMAASTSAQRNAPLRIDIGLPRP